MNASLYRLEKTPEFGVLEPGYYVVCDEGEPAAVVRLEKPTNIGAVGEELAMHGGELGSVSGTLELGHYRLTFRDVHIQWVWVEAKQRLDLVP